MMKFLQKQVDTDLVKIALLFSLMYFLFFNIAIINYRLDHYNGEIIRVIKPLIKQSLIVYINIFILFFGLTIHRLVFLNGTFLLFLSGAIATYYLFFFGITPTEKIMAGFYNSGINKIYEEIHVRMVTWSIFCLAICYCSFQHFKIQTSKIFLTRILAAACLLITIDNIIVPWSMVLKNYFPFQYLHNTYLYLTH